MSNVSDDDLDKILASGDMEAIEKFLADSENDDTESDEKDASPSVDVEEELIEQEEDDAEDESKTEAEKAPEAEEAKDDEAEESEDKNPVILTKDGKHTIDFSVLQGTRQQVKDLKALVEKSNRENEAMQKQLKKLNLDPAKLPEDVEFSDEFFDEVGELDESLANGLRAIAEQNKFLLNEVKSLKSQKTIPTEDDGTDDAVLTAIQKNETLVEWQKNDPDKWQKAHQVDQILQNDPSFAGKTLDENFQEVVRRVNAMYGITESPNPKQEVTLSKEEKAEAARKKMEEALAKKEKTPITSLTDIGRSAETGRSLSERLADMNETEISAYIEKNNLSSSQIDALLMG